MDLQKQTRQKGKHSCKKTALVVSTFLRVVVLPLAFVLAVRFGGIIALLLDTATDLEDTNIL